MGHKHHGKSSSKFLSSDEILKEFNFKGDETFLDAGCGDGYISIKAVEDYLPDGEVYAVDIHDESIEALNDYIKENNLENLSTIVADFTKGVPDVKDASVDAVLMLNVFHGFTDDDQSDVIGELSRLIKDDGKIALMDFKPIDMPIGPPTEIRISPSELEEIFNRHNLKKVYLNDEIGAEFEGVKSHYLMMFEKE